MKPVVKYLRTKGYASVIYLDDMLCISNTYGQCLENTKETIETLERLGFVINVKKSELTPCTTRKYLGLIIDSKQRTLKLMKGKIDKLLELLKLYLTLNSCTILQFSQLIGKLVAA